MATTEILKLLRAPRLDMPALEAELDAASHQDRMSFLRELTPKLQEKLFDAAQGQRITLEHFVPKGVGPLREVIHEGQNTLPSFRHFQKRFCAPSASHTPELPKLWGYNHQTFSPVTGPGYFSCYEDPGSGQVWIDYRQIPPERPQDWPKIIANHKKLGVVVYHGMVDRMWRVSSHVSVGRAYKRNPMPAWFTLVRRDVR